MVHGRNEQEVEQQVAQIKQVLGTSCRAMTAEQFENFKENRFANPFHEG